jgi:hypothetical protein
MKDLGSGKRTSDEFEGRVSDKQGEYSVLRVNLESISAQSRSVPDRPLLAHFYRWPGLEEPIGFDTNYNTGYNAISYFDYDYTWVSLPWASTRTDPRGTKVMGLGSHSLFKLLRTWYVDPEIRGSGNY